MAEPTPEYGLLRFSTDALPPPERFDVWRDLLSRKLLHVAMDPLSEGPFQAKAALRILPGLRVGAGVIGPTAHYRTRSIAAGEPDDIALMVNLSGPFLVRGAKGEFALGEGDACLVDCSETGSYVRASQGKLMCLRLPKSALGGFARRVEDMLNRRIPRQLDALRLLTAYVTTLYDADAPELSPAASRMVVDHVADLLALIVSAGGEAAGAAAGRGVRAARLGAIKAHISGRLGAFDLSIDEVAASQKVSPRYVRQLFEGEGASFSSYVANERLARAHAMLTSPRFGEVPVSTIAYDVGFGDLSYFNRLFRRCYQATPSDVRAEATALAEDGAQATSGGPPRRA